MLLIGLAGKARTGKDTIALHLEDQWGVFAIALAEPIKFGLMEMIGLDEDHLFGERKEDVIESLGVSPRRLMQTLGDWGRSVSEDFWLRTMAKRIAGLEAAVITDVRYDNEADFVRGLGGVIWHVDRPGVDRVSEHTSESGVRRIDGEVLIRNDDTIETLRMKVDDLIVPLLHKAGLG